MRGLNKDSRRFCCFLVFLGDPVGWNNATEQSNAEEPLAAGVAAVGRETQPTFQGDGYAILHTITRNPLEIEISAARTVRIAMVTEGHALGVKPAIAAVASPWLTAHQRKRKIQAAIAMGPKAIGTATLRADHLARVPRIVPMQNTENAQPEQV